MCAPWEVWALSTEWCQTNKDKKKTLSYFIQQFLDTPREIIRTQNNDRTPRFYCFGAYLRSFDPEENMRLNVTQVMAIPFHWHYEEMVFFFSTRKKWLENEKRARIFSWSLIPIYSVRLCSKIALSPAPPLSVRLDPWLFLCVRLHGNDWQLRASHSSKPRQ